MPVACVSVASTARPLRFGEPTIADAILDRIIHNSHRIALEGDSMRRKKAARPTSKTAKRIPTDFNNQATKSQRRHAVRYLAKLLSVS
ncbi:ATP-binding protein [Bradyrhizobium sp. USDA 4529]